MTRPRRNASGGQAMIEFLVSAAALVPLLVGVVIIGRLQDLRSHAQQSARFGAYARAFGTPVAETQSQIRTRFFGDPNAPVREGDARDGARADTTANAHWRDSLRNERALVSNAVDVALVAAERAPAGRAGGLLEMMAATADRVSSVSGGSFDVEHRGYHEIAVRVRLADLSPAIDSGPLTLDARASVFGGDWSSGGPAQTAARATALAPATLIRRIRPVLAPIDWALAALEPAFRELCLGRVDAELVPADRLGIAGSGDAGTWIAPCP